MPNYHLPTIATLAGIALASGYIATNSLDGRKKRKKRVKQKLQKGWDKLLF
jgi:hypothetical protein